MEPLPVVPAAGGLSSGAALGRAEPPPSAPPAPAPAASAPPAPTEAERAAAARSADEAAIRGALAGYKAAYESLDAAAVRRVVRSLTAAQERSLANQFRDYKSYTLQLQNISIALNGSAATVKSRVARTAVPKAGRTLSNADDVSFELQKEGNGWVITRLSGAASR